MRYFKASFATLSEIPRKELKKKKKTTHKKVVKTRKKGGRHEQYEFPKVTLFRLSGLFLFKNMHLNSHVVL